MGRSLPVEPLQIAGASAHAAVKTVFSQVSGLTQVPARNSEPVFPPERNISDVLAWLAEK